MVAFMTSIFILFGWLCFIGLGIAVLLWLDYQNFYMPPAYISWGVLLYLVTLWVTSIS